MKKILFFTSMLLSSLAYGASRTDYLTVTGSGTFRGPFGLYDQNTTNWSEWHYTGLSGGFTKSRIFAHTRGGAGDLFSLYASTANADPNPSVNSGDSEIRMNAGSSPLFRFTLWGDGFTVPDYSMDFLRSGLSITNHMSLNSINGVNPSTFSFYDGDTSNYVGLRASSTISNDNTYVLPASSGTSGQAILTDGRNNWYFGTPSGDNLGNHIATKTITASYGMTVSTVLVSSYIEAPFTARDTLVQLTPLSLDVSTTSSYFGEYYTGNTVQYRLYAYRTYNGAKIYSSTYVESGIYTIQNDNDSVELSWPPATGADGYLLVRDVGLASWEDYSADVGNITTIIDDNCVEYLCWGGGPPATPSYIDFLYGHRTGNSAWAVFGQAGYFDGSSVIGGASIPTNDNLNYGLSVYNTATSTVPFFVHQTNASSATGAIFRGYSDGGYVNQSVVQVQNSNGQKVIDFASSNLYPADDGNLNLIGYATAAYDQYSLGAVQSINNSTEASGDKRVGGVFFIRDGAWNNSKIQLLTRDPSAGFQYALVVKGDATGVSGISAPTARLHIPAGSATAGTAPIKLTVGPYTTAAVAGQIEWSNSFPQALTFSPAAAERYRLTMTDSSVVTLTSGRVPFSTTNGRLTDSANYTYNSTTNLISVGSITVSGNTSLAVSSVSTYQIIRIGTSTAFGAMGGSVFFVTTSTANAAATETTFYTQSLTTGTLSGTGDCITYQYTGTFAGTISTDKRVRVKLGGTTICDSGNLAVTSASEWTLRGSICRISQSSQKNECSLNTSFASLGAYADYSTSTENLGSTLNLVLTGAGTNASDVTGEIGRGEFRAGTRP